MRKTCAVCKDSRSKYPMKYHPFYNIWIFREHWRRFLNPRATRLLIVHLQILYIAWHFRPLQTLISRNCSIEVFAMLVYSSLDFLKENIRYWGENVLWLFRYRSFTNNYCDFLPHTEKWINTLPLTWNFSFKNDRSFNLYFFL